MSPTASCAGALPTVTEEPEGHEQAPGQPGGGDDPDGDEAARAARNQQLMQSLRRAPPGTQGLAALQIPPPPGLDGPDGQGMGASQMMAAPKAISDPLSAFEWLDENGLMIYVPNPLKVRARVRVWLAGWVGVPRGCVRVLEKGRHTRTTRSRRRPCKRAAHAA
jgi:coiled-coil and C2 domain-containing protein 2A